MKEDKKDEVAECRELWFFTWGRGRTSHPLGYPIIGDGAFKLAGIRGTAHITFPR